MDNLRGVNATGDLQISARPGYIEHVVATNVTAAGTLTVYDSLTETGTIISQVTLAIGNSPVYVPIKQNVSTGIFVGFDGTLAGRVQVSFK
jgi:hypothetical protein